VWVLRTKLEQPLKTWSILNDEFPKLGHPCRMSIRVSSTTDASKASGVDSKTTEARAKHNEQALESRATCNHGVQRGFGDGDEFKPEQKRLNCDG
jgi:hypothetical protein